MSVKAKLRRWLRDHDSYGEDADERFATAAGLRQLADLLEDEPESELPYSVAVYHSVYGWRLPEGTTERSELRRLARQLGGRWEKGALGESFTLTRKLGGRVEYRLSTAREAVCEKRVVGQHYVEKPDYTYAPTHRVLEDIVEWDCPEVL